MIIGLLYYIPVLPAMPAEVLTAMNFITGLLTSSVGLLKFVYGTSFFNVVITSTVALLLFDQIYELTFWILGKIPLINVKR